MPTMRCAWRARKRESGARRRSRDPAVVQARLAVVGEDRRGCPGSCRSRRTTTRRALDALPSGARSAPFPWRRLVWRRRRCGIGAGRGGGVVVMRRRHARAATSSAAGAPRTTAGRSSGPHGSPARTPRDVPCCRTSRRGREGLAAREVQPHRGHATIASFVGGGAAVPSATRVRRGARARDPDHNTRITRTARTNFIMSVQPQAEGRAGARPRARTASRRRPASAARRPRRAIVPPGARASRRHGGPPAGRRTPASRAAKRRSCGPSARVSQTTSRAAASPTARKPAPTNWNVSRSRRSSGSPSGAGAPGRRPVSAACCARPLLSAACSTAAPKSPYEAMPEHPVQRRPGRPASGRELPGNHHASTTTSAPIAASVRRTLGNGTKRLSTACTGAPARSRRRQAARSRSARRRELPSPATSATMASAVRDPAPTTSVRARPRRRSAPTIGRHQPTSATRVVTAAAGRRSPTIESSSQCTEAPPGCPAAPLRPDGLHPHRPPEPASSRRCAARPASPKPTCRTCCARCAWRLEADVALPVVRDFIARGSGPGARRRGRGLADARPGAGRHRHRELARTMGEGAAADIDLAAQPPAVILMAGLQGAARPRRPPSWRT